MYMPKILRPVKPRSLVEEQAQLITQLKAQLQEKTEECAGLRNVLVEAIRDLKALRKNYLHDHT